MYFLVGYSYQINIFLFNDFIFVHIFFVFFSFEMTIMEIQLLFRTNIGLQFAKGIRILFALVNQYFRSYLPPLYVLISSLEIPIQLPHPNSSISRQISSPQSFTTIPLSEHGTGQHSLLYCRRLHSFWKIKEVKGEVYLSTEIMPMSEEWGHHVCCQVFRSVNQYFKI